MRKAFTLIELLVYTAIFSLVIVAFISIFVASVRVESNESSTAEVETQSQFLLKQIQYYVQQSSLVDMPQDTATTTLKLRMANPSLDPTYIKLTNGALLIQQGTGALQALSSNQVIVSNLVFTRHANPPGHDTVSVTMTVAYNTGNIQRAFSQALQTSIARVSAATFDSNLVPSSTNTWSVGATGNVWQSINNLIWFSGSNVGIGSADTSPTQQLEVAGGVRLNTTASQPSC